MTHTNNKGEIMRLSSIKVFILFAIILFSIGCSVPMKLPLTEHVDHYQPTKNMKNGLVFIYREAEFSGSGRGIFIQANGVRVGGLNSGTYFVYESSPGEVTISAEDNLGAGPSRSFIIEASKKYYVRGSFKTGAWDAVPYIEIVPDIEGEQATKSLRYATLERGKPGGENKPIQRDDGSI